MTGPEHYRRAEDYLEKARGSHNPEYEAYVTRAQVHATLALAAATAMNGYSDEGSHAKDYVEWNKVAGVPAS